MKAFLPVVLVLALTLVPMVPETPASGPPRSHALDAVLRLTGGDLDREGQALDWSTDPPTTHRVTGRELLALLERVAPGPHVQGTSLDGAVGVASSEAPLPGPPGYCPQGLGVYVLYVIHDFGTLYPASVVHAERLPFRIPPLGSSPCPVFMESWADVTFDRESPHLRYPILSCAGAQTWVHSLDAPLGSWICDAGRYISVSGRGGTWTFSFGFFVWMDLFHGSDGVVSVGSEARYLPGLP